MKEFAGFLGSETVLTPGGRDYVGKTLAYLPIRVQKILVAAVVVDPSDRAVVRLIPDAGRTIAARRYRGIRPGPGAHRIRRRNNAARARFRTAVVHSRGAV